jgi:tripartite-type tricarboxylate transporter receptor subunit TctC
MRKSNELLTSAALTCVLGLMAAGAFAQTYPSRPVRLIINVDPGGGSDILARRLSPGLSQNLGQNVIVENKPGAAGILGTSAAASAVPDGYTLTMISSSHTSNAPLHKSLPYDPVNSFSPVILYAMSPQVLLVQPGAPFRTIKELIAYSKANPEKLNMGSSGTGSTPHLSGELLKMMSGINFTHIPYKGGGPAMTALMAGQLDLLFVVTQTAKPQVTAGKVRILGAASAKRLKTFPDAPTIAESGVAGYEASNWAGVLAPARTPAGIVKTLYEAILKTTNAKELNDWMEQQGLEPVDIGPEEFRKVLQSEITKWTRVVKAANIPIE